MRVVFALLLIACAIALASAHFFDIEESLLSVNEAQDEAQALNVAYTNDFFLWSSTNGNNIVIFKNGTTKNCKRYWVGYAAWNDLNAVKADIKSAVAAGTVPFIQSYQFGDNGLRTEYSKALTFDTGVAQAIGRAFAIVNLDTEWDVDAVYSSLTSASGIKNFKDRINAYRTYAPNTILVSSPGLWKSTSTYTPFDSVDALLNLRADLHHATSNVASCTSRTDGSSYTDGKTKTAALTLVDKILADKAKMDSAWGTVSGGKFMTADMALTSCGWGAAGQAELIQKIVDNMGCLVKAGWRGMILRNEAPSAAERFMGVNNEGGFVWSSNSAAATQISRGLTLAKSLIANPASASCTVTAPSFTVTKSSGSNDYWIQVKIVPSASVKTVTAKWLGKSKVLSPASWGNDEFTASPGAQIPYGTAVTFEIVPTSGATVSKQITW